MIERLFRRRKGKPGGGRDDGGEREMEARERMEAEGKGEEAAMGQTALVYFGQSGTTRVLPVCIEALGYG